MRSLVPIRARTVTPAVVEHAGGNLPANFSPEDMLILRGIGDLLLFAAPQKDAADEKRITQLYMEAIAPFHPAIRSAAISHMRFNNQRNPYRPTHQDVRDCCLAIKKQWSSAVQNYFFPAYQRQWYLDGAPLTDECEVPSGWVKEWLTKHLAGLDADGLRWLSRETIEMIPPECFAEGLREKLLQAIAKQEEKRLEQERFQQYLDEMDPDLRECRRRVAHAGLSEDEIMELARAELRAEEQIAASLNALRASDPLLLEWAEVVARQDVRMWNSKGVWEKNALISRQLECAKASDLEAEYRNLAARGRLLSRAGQDWYRLGEEAQATQVAEEVARFVAGERP